MDLFLVEYDNGGEYEQQEVETIGIFDNLNKATELVTSVGFVPVGDSKDFFERQHDNVSGECVAHKDYAFITVFNLNKPQGDYLDCFLHHYKKRIVKGNPYNVLRDNQYVKVCCCHCQNYIMDINTLFRGNVVSSICTNCNKTNYPHSWIEEPILKNENHHFNVAVYFDETKK